MILFLLPSSLLYAIGGFCARGMADYRLLYEAEEAALQEAEEEAAAAAAAAAA
eukprot:CAMPEP_0202914062 /NCGR_PEP_ID=MMETSP1392-20130828/62146_1 /ASSEMBLY_ACC=CAM_ASM_000868 /TAXON_ID=225041 /ORGANISM="Chlamydomonas chlamydogama, Strain SAG 11-48b" /LENGTH=52 /DNA_ID=CAMNT_0049605575 /DNA_START=53 /DNA_END=207 /DNA_ORIENTATION=-